MRNLILCLMFGLIFVAVGCADEDETNGDINGNGDNGGGGSFDPLRNITLDHVDGSPGAGQISAGGDVVFYLRLKNTGGSKGKGITNGFRVYSTDGATWNSTSIDTTGTPSKDDFDLIYATISFGVTGAGADTVAVGGVAITGPGLADGFDDIAYTITIGPINASNVGKNICVDSSYYPPTGSWLWDMEDGAHSPGWDGPHCFEVVQ